MSTLSHTPRGAATAHVFWGKPVVYVEGSEDVLFWEQLFLHGCHEAVKSLSVGERQALLGYAEYIQREDATMMVALDAEYGRILATLVSHERILYTYGHSMENTLYCPAALAQIAHRYTREDAPPFEMVQKWVLHMETTLRPILAYDVANAMLGTGHRVMGDSGERFMRQGNWLPVADLLRERVREVATDFASADIQAAEQAMRASGQWVLLMVRGHFLTSCANKLVREACSRAGRSRPNISRDHLYSLLVNFCTTQCPHQCSQRDYYYEGCARALVSFADAVARGHP